MEDSRISCRLRVSLLDTDSAGALASWFLALYLAGELSKVTSATGYSFTRFGQETAELWSKCRPASLAARSAAVSPGEEG